MNELKITATNSSPEVTLDIENNVFEINGESRPEDAYSFYKPILNWLKELKNLNIDKNIVFKFDLVYFNSTSTKFLYNIIELLKQINELSTSIIVEWHYNEKDVDIKEAGEELSEMTEIKFYFIKK